MKRGGIADPRPQKGTLYQVTAFTGDGRTLANIGTYDERLARYQWSTFITLPAAARVVFRVDGQEERSWTNPATQSSSSKRAATTSAEPIPYTPASKKPKRARPK